MKQQNDSFTSQFDGAYNSGEVIFVPDARGGKPRRLSEISKTPDELQTARAASGRRQKDLEIKCGVAHRRRRVG